MKFNAIILVIIYSTLSFILSISYVDFNISGGVYSIKYYLGRNEESSVIDQEKEGIKIRNETYRPELSPKFRLVKNRSYEFDFGIYTCFEYQDEIRLNDNLYTDIHFYGMGEDLPEDAAPQPEAEPQKQPKPRSAAPKQEQPPVPCICTRCNQPIKRVKLKDGSIMQAAEFAATHDGLCADCYKATRLNVA